MTRIGVVLAAVACLGAAKAEPPASPPDAQGWSVVERNGVCLLFSEAKLAFVAPDGQQVGLMAPGALGGVKRFEIDDGSVEAQFRADSGAVFAPAGDELLGRLLQSTRIRADWPDNQIDTAPPVMQSLIDLRRCGARVAAKKAADAARAEKRRDLADRLARAGAALGSTDAAGGEAVGRARGTQGGVCFKSREWTSGFNRNCVYNCLGSEAVETIGSTQLCPLTIHR